MHDTSSTDFIQFEQIRDIVELEFDVEENFMEYGAPTFYVRLEQDSKKAFLRLIKRLGPLGFIPTLQRKGEKIVLKIVRKPVVKPSRRIINVALFFATVGTTLLTGYFLSRGLVDAGRMPNAMAGAVTFTLAIMAIFGSHEMGHKFLANLHGIEASTPYFIPGPPLPFGIGTFGAVIQQKSPAPNKDALFDLGVSGPIVGFVVTVIVTIIGVQTSYLIPSAEVLPGVGFIQMPLLFRFLAATLLNPPPGEYVILLHPIAFASWVGMLTTMLNLIPAGTLDGGHAARGSLGPRARSILSFVSIMILVVLGHYLMAVVAFSLSMYRHPGPLDDVSKLSTRRKLATIALVSIFILCTAPVWPVP